MRAALLALLLVSCAGSRIHLKPDPEEPADPVVTWDGVVCTEHSDRITCHVYAHDDR